MNGAGWDGIIAIVLGIVVMAALVAWERWSQSRHHQHTARERDTHVDA
jgi:hypothetical protein